MDSCFPFYHYTRILRYMPSTSCSLFRLSIGVFSVCYTVSCYMCIPAPSSGNVFHYVWLRCYTDCGCLDLRHLYCNINSSILQHQEILSLIILSNPCYLNCGTKVFWFLGSALISRIGFFIPYWNSSVFYCINTYVSHLFPLGCKREVW